MRLIQEGGMNWIYNDDGSLLMKAKIKNSHRTMSESQIIESLTGSEVAKEEPAAKPVRKRNPKKTSVSTSDDTSAKDEQVDSEG